MEKKFKQLSNEIFSVEVLKVLEATGITGIDIEPIKDEIIKLTIEQLQDYLEDSVKTVLEELGLYPPPEIPKEIDPTVLNLHLKKLGLLPIKATKPIQDQVVKVLKEQGLLPVKPVGLNKTQVTKLIKQHLKKILTEEDVRNIVKETHASREDLIMAVKEDIKAALQDLKVSEDASA